MAILNEIEYQYRTRLWGDIKPFVGKGLFIHFGKTPKLGVRVAGKFHSDPAGVYLYDLDWLVNSPRFTSGDQFGVTFPYWTIVELKRDDSGIVMSRLTDPAVDALAERQKWTLWDEFRKENEGKSPANLFWGYIKSCSMMLRGGKPTQNAALRNLLRGGKPTQNAALRNISYVWDDGLGVIHSYEPNQAVVLNPSAIRVVASGNQNPNGKQSRRIPGDKSTPETQISDTTRGHKFAFTELLKKLRGEYGGEISWNQKMPSLKFEYKSANFKITWFPHALEGKIRMETRWGRAEKTYAFTEHDFATKTMDEIMAFFTGIVVKTGLLAVKKKDLFFTPMLSEREATDAVRRIAPNGFDIATTIDNDYHTMTVEGKKTVDLGENTMEVFVSCLNGADEIRYSVTVKMNQHALIAARANHIDDLAENIRDNFNRSLEPVRPSSESYRSKFYHKDEYRAFIGLVAHFSGIESLRGDHADEINEWHNYQHADEIYKDISRVY